MDWRLFLDHRGAFLGRKTAKIKVVEFGQVEKTDIDRQPELFSEDLWEHVIQSPPRKYPAPALGMAGNGRNLWAVYRPMRTTLPPAACPVTNFAHVSIRALRFSSKSDRA